MYALESRDRTLLWQRLVPGVARSLLVMRDRRSDISEAAAMLAYKHHRIQGKVITIRSRQQDEVMHSAGRVLADRSVLFKYMSPNLALVMTEGLDTQSKTMISVQIMDLITGKVFFSATHKKVTGPFRVVHSKNRAVYTFYNEKARRTEVASMEM